MKQISRLQYITTGAALAEQACKGGADWIQLRLKDISYEEYKRAAMEVQAVCKKYSATFIVNDSIRLALEIGADGVHVGKEDPLPQADIEAMLARGGIIGVTANEVADFEHLAGKKVSYIGLGPFRFTQTKKKLSPILGLEGYQRIFDTLKERNIPYPPVVGIGGVTEDDIIQLLGTGLYGVAVSGAISNAADMTDAARRLKEKIYGTGKAVERSVVVAATKETVWNALTTPAIMKEWLHDSPIIVTSDWQQGSAITFAGQWHGRAYEDKGTILAIEPLQRLEYSYLSHLSGLSDIPEHYVETEFTLHASGKDTLFQLKQSNFALGTMYDHANFYWTVTLDRLKKVIEKYEGRTEDRG